MSNTTLPAKSGPPLLWSKHHLSFWYWISQIHTNTEEGTSGWNGRKEAQRRRRRRQKWGRGEKKRGKRKQRRRQNASLCLLAVELLFEMKIQSVWGITVDWQAHGSQAVICTPVIWSMVIIAVCVRTPRSVCVRLWSGNLNKHNVVNKKTLFFFDWPNLPPLLQHKWWNTSRIRFFFSFFQVCFSSSPLIGSLLLLSFLYTFTPSFLHLLFIPASGAEKPPTHSIGLERQ